MLSIMTLYMLCMYVSEHLYSTFYRSHKGAVTQLSKRSNKVCLKICMERENVCPVENSCSVICVCKVLYMRWYKKQHL